MPSLIDLSMGDLGVAARPRVSDSEDPLGLVVEVMALHDGGVDVRPNEPVGTVFRSWLPQDR